jgi:energy-coupling factor transport system substrate-specific component
MRLELGLDWLQVCAEGQTTPCVAPIQAAYLVALLIGVVLLFVIARRARDLTTATLTLMTVAIAINIAVGSISTLLRLPIYLDSIGTVLVGALAGPWAGALTGILSNLIWSILPIPGGAGPVAAFFAPVAGIIGLMAGFWASRGVFQLRTDDVRVGGFLSLAAGIVGTAVAFLVVQATIGIPDLAEKDPDALLANQTQFLVMALAFVGIGVVVGWLAGRTVFAFSGDDPRIRTYLIGATAISAFALVFALVRLVFGPTGYLSGVDGVLDDGTPDGFLFGWDLTSLAFSDPLGLIIAIALAGVVGAAVLAWARRGEHARLFPVWVGGLTTGLVAAMISAPIAAGVFGGVTGAGTDALVALFRTLGLNVFQSAFAQGLTSDPLDKTISYTIVFLILGALPVTVRTMYSRGEATVAE